MRSKEFQGFNGDTVHVRKSRFGNVATAEQASVEPALPLDADVVGVPDVFQRPGVGSEVDQPTAKPAHVPAAGDASDVFSVNVIEEAGERLECVGHGHEWLHAEFYAAEIQRDPNILEGDTIDDFYVLCRR